MYVSILTFNPDFIEPPKIHIRFRIVSSFIPYFNVEAFQI